MRILGIETSCDETAVAVLETTNDPFVMKMHTNLIYSQIPTHREFGGVVPNLAKREHQKHLIPLIIQALKQVDSFAHTTPTQYKEESIIPFFHKNQSLLESFKANVTQTASGIDLIAVTNGPGLEPALWVGVTTARSLATVWNIPLIGVDHMHGHICANFILHNTFQTPVFPAIGLTVSGGHTQLILMKKPLHYQLLGETLDDAAGEAFDKVARMLGMPYPGGPHIAKSAENGDPSSFPLPRPMIHSKDLNFSFSGLKTAVRYLIEDLGDEAVRKQTANIAASFQQAVIDVIVRKTIQATQQYRAHSVLLGGGVIANQSLRQILQDNIHNHTDAVCHIPPPILATDNAAMIACAGGLEHIHHKITHSPHTITVNANKQIDM